MKVCYVVINLEHYKYFFSDLNPQESLVVLDKRSSALKIAAKKLYRDKNNPEWIFSLMLFIINRQVKLKNIDVLVVTDLAQIRFPNGFVRWLKTRYPSLKTVMMFYNKASALYGLNGNISIDSISEKDTMLPFDKIYTYDPEEAQSFGFEYYTAISDVSKLVGSVQESPCSDVFYCGSIKHEWKNGRFDAVDQVYQYLNANNVKCDFHLVISKDLQLPEREYVGTSRLPYLDVIKRSISSKAILEIVSDGQNGVTERFYDALMYNRKFITNNSSVLHHPYYNSKYMKVFEKPSDIDIKWLLNDETVEYNYDGKYTPKGMYKMLEEMWNNQRYN